MKSEEFESIREQLRSAFPPNSGLKDLRIFGDNQRQRVHDDPEMQSMVEDFEGKKWSDIRRDCITKHRLNLSLFSESAYRYYLPAFIDYALRANLEDTTLTDFILYSLTPHDRTGSPNDHTLKRTEGFTPKQRRLILDFILLTKDQYNDREPLLAYWRNKNVNNLTSNG
jgi:hypothetical protein